MRLPISCPRMFIRQKASLSILSPVTATVNSSKHIGPGIGRISSVGAAHVVAGGRLDRPFPVFGLDEDQNAPEFKRLLVAGGQARRLTAGLSARIATYP
ncbi:Tonb-dependent siderophore receptor [Rhodovulum sulfidophilum]|uniref:Tonb-dependent siderophore receptor n=1 Tax=Rhodovulum sulfidophilum TaxID=35806 RepID=A0A0D6B521_RHOSU|nr:Tonb-dependent siderophore receptor [Rhodovulum sulfidophilum]